MEVSGHHWDSGSHIGGRAQALPLLEPPTMSHYPPQAYGVFQPQYPAYDGQNHYPSQYPAQGAHVAAYPAYPHVQARLTSPPPEPHTAPDVPAVNSELASHAIERLASAELSRAGFDSAEPAALRRLELEVAACPSASLALLIRKLTGGRCLQVVEELYKSAHEYANLANRAGPVAKDVLLASQDWGMETNVLHRFAVKAKKKNNRTCTVRFSSATGIEATYKLCPPWSCISHPPDRRRQSCCRLTMKTLSLSSPSRYGSYHGTIAIFPHYLPNTHISGRLYVDIMSFTMPTCSLQPPFSLHYPRRPLYLRWRRSSRTQDWSKNR